MRPWRSCKTAGLEAVTMRRVAAALDTGAASLYVYVSGRDGLLQAMLDRVTATIELEQPDPSVGALSCTCCWSACAGHCLLIPGSPR